MDQQRPNISIESGLGAATQNNKEASTRYVFTWRSHGLGADATDIDGLITALDAAADGVRLLKSAGVRLEADKAAGGDVCLVTTDPSVAQKYGFEAEVTKIVVADEGAAADETINAKAGA